MAWVRRPGARSRVPAPEPRCAAVRGGSRGRASRCRPRGRRGRRRLCPRVSARSPRAPARPPRAPARPQFPPLQQEGRSCGPPRGLPAPLSPRVRPSLRPAPDRRGARVGVRGAAGPEPTACPCPPAAPSPFPEEPSPRRGRRGSGVRRARVADARGCVLLTGCPRAEWRPQALFSETAWGSGLGRPCPEGERGVSCTAPPP